MPSRPDHPPALTVVATVAVVVAAVLTMSSCGSSATNRSPRLFSSDLLQIAVPGGTPGTISGNGATADVGPRGSNARAVREWTVAASGRTAALAAAATAIAAEGGRFFGLSCGAAGAVLTGSAPFEDHATSVQLSSSSTGIRLELQQRSSPESWPPTFPDPLVAGDCPAELSALITP